MLYTFSIQLLYISKIKLVSSIKRTHFGVKECHKLVMSNTCQKRCHRSDNFLHTNTNMVLLDNSSFIIRLEKFANSAKNDSSLSVTFKRYNGQNRPKPREGRPDLPEPEVFLCLMRAQAKSKKISTIVRQEDVPRMMNMYGQFMKSNMDGLKRVKKAKSKSKATKG